MVSFDVTQGDPGAKRLRGAMLRGDWPTVRDVLAAVEDPEVASFYVRVASDVTGTEGWLDDVARSHPRDPLPRLVLGARAVVWAWEARGTGPGHQVSQQAFATFQGRLTAAEDVLDGVLALEPDNVHALWQLIITSRGRQLGIDETRARFDRAVAVNPGHLPAHEAMLTQLCDKWGGSHDLMHAFARDAMLGAPGGSPLGVLVPLAHIEHWLRDFDRATFGTFRYFKGREVRRQLHEAADRSVRHADFRLRPGWLTVPNTFAMAFSMAGEHGAAAKQFRLMRGRATRYPWAYPTSSATGFYYARRLRAFLRF